MKRRRRWMHRMMTSFSLPLPHRAMVTSLSWGNHCPAAMTLPVACPHLSNLEPP